MQEEIIKTIIQTAIPTVIALIPTIVLTFTNLGKIPDIVKKLDISIQNDLAILWNQLNNEIKKVVESDRCDVETLANIEQLYKQYEAIGGNHGMEIRVQQARTICRKGEK